MFRQNQELKDADLVKIFNQHKDRLFRFSNSMLSDSYLAEDVVQEVFVRMWRKKESLASIENIGAWCMTVTRNLCIDKIRVKKKKQTQDIETVYDIGDHETPSRVFEKEELFDLVKKTIEKFPLDQKQVLQLRDIEGLAYKEIAEVTGYTLEKVKVSLYRARKNLKSKLQKINYEKG